MNSDLDGLLGTQVVAFRPGLVEVCGSVNAALMLSQALYWAPRAQDSRGYFYKTQQEWEKETGLKRAQQENARKRLGRLGFWFEERRGVPARLYFWIDFPQLYALLIQSAEILHLEMRQSRNVEAAPSGMQDRTLQDRRLDPDKNAQDRQTFNSKTTQETTQEKHQRNIEVLTNWSRIKTDLSNQLPSVRKWLPRAFLLKVLSGNVLLVSLPTKGSLISAARAARDRLVQVAKGYGYQGVQFTRYPDAYECERLRKEHPEFYDGMFSARRKQPGLTVVSATAAHAE
jgi:hypothetical protein